MQLQPKAAVETAAIRPTMLWCLCVPSLNTSSPMLPSLTRQWQLGFHQVAIHSRQPCPSGHQTAQGLSPPVHRPPRQAGQGAQGVTAGAGRRCQATLSAPAARPCQSSRAARRSWWQASSRTQVAGRAAVLIVIAAAAPLEGWGGQQQARHRRPPAAHLCAQLAATGCAATAACQAACCCLPSIQAVHSGFQLSHQAGL